MHTDTFRCNVRHRLIIRYSVYLGLNVSTSFKLIRYFPKPEAYYIP